MKPGNGSKREKEAMCNVCKFPSLFNEFFYPNEIIRLVQIAVNDMETEVKTKAELIQVFKVKGS